MPRIPFETAVEQLEKVLLSRRMDSESAGKIAYEMARSSLEGTYSHGINRFPRLIGNIDEIRACGLRPDELRRQARAQEAGLQQAAAAVMQAWFERLDL